MFRMLATIITLIVALQGAALAQGGMLDSILGPGGLGLWGSSDPNQFNAQQYYGSPPQEPTQQAYQQPAMPGQQPAMPGQQPGSPYGYQQGYPPQGYGSPQYPGSPYGSQPGVYSDWHNYPPQDQAPSGPPPVRYSAPPGQAGPAPQVQAGPPAPPAAPPGAPLRPGQYSPGQAPPPNLGQYPGGVDDLPAGAVRVTTTTPEGTTVQFYPPDGQPVTGQPRVQPQTRRPKAPGAAKPRQTQAQPREQQGVAAPSAGSDMSVVMPKPVEIPAGQDPRAGWTPR
jgi:hypothetical protein